MDRVAVQVRFVSRLYEYKTVHYRDYEGNKRLQSAEEKFSKNCCKLRKQENDAKMSSRGVCLPQIRIHSS